jgi:L-asparaginase
VLPYDAGFPTAPRRDRLRYEVGDRVPCKGSFLRCLTRHRIAVIGTGGSISMPGRHRLDLYEYADYTRVLEVDELLAMFPEISEVADAVPIRFRALPSSSIQATDWLELNDKISEIVRDDSLLEGIVITHGTDTVEETAYFLHLTAKVDVPIVLVAAQRPPNGLGTDAGINIVNALRVGNTSIYSLSEWGASAGR